MCRGTVFKSVGELSSNLLGELSPKAVLGNCLVEELSCSPVYPVREHMTLVMPNYKTMLPVWEHLIFLRNWDKNKNTVAYSH